MNLIQAPAQWVMKAQTPAFYARKCDPGETCVLGHYKNTIDPRYRSEAMEERAVKCSACPAGQYTDGSTLNASECSE